MATRFYFDNTTAAPVSPAFDAAWEQTGSADRLYSPRKGAVAIASSPMTDKTDTVPITTTQQILSRQYVTDPLPYPIQISTSYRLSMALRVLEAAAAANAFLNFSLRVCSNDGSIIRGTVGSALTNSGTEYTTAAQTRIFTLTGLGGSNIVTQTGDRLVMEIGANAQGPTSASTFTHRYGYVIGTADFALTSGLTTDLNPWWEMEQDLFPPLPLSVQAFKSTGLAVTDGWR